MTKIFKYLLIGTFFVSLFACENEDYQGPIPYPTLMEAAEDAGLTTLVTAVRSIPGLEATLQDQNEITVFAPTNEAFANALVAFDAGDLDELVENIGGPMNLETVLGFHVVPTVIFSEQLDETNVVTTLSGQQLTVNRAPGVVTVIDATGATATVVQADVEIENGVVHVIDRVLIPSIELPSPNLVEAATEAGLTTLLEAVTAVDGLADNLLAAGEITVFAPTNEAFAAALEVFGAADLNELMLKIGGIENLERVLGFHVVPAVAFSSDLEASNTFTTLAGQDIVVEVAGGEVTVTDQLGRTARVVAADVEIANGVVHVIDGVMLPDLMLPNVVEAATGAGLTTLIDAVTAADLGDALLNADAITVFAPTNEAFGAALEAFNADNLDQLVARIGGVENLQTVLGFHVVPAVAFSSDLEATNTFTTLAGQELTVEAGDSGVTVTDALGNTSNVVTADVAIENGVVHVIDGVLLPEFTLPNVVEAATAANLTVLLDAVTAAGLGQTLLDAEEITVFAPTNQAFVDLLGALSLNSLEELIDAVGVEELVRILGFHVVPATAFSFDLADGEQTVPTLADEELTVTRSGGAVTVTDARGNTFDVVAADVAIDNGVVHVIDGVLLPSEDLPNVVEAATDAGLTVLLDAVTEAGLGQTLLDAEAITVFAPTNQAFVDLLNELSLGSLDELVDAIGIEGLQKVLGFHVVPSVAFAADLQEGEQMVPTLADEMLTVTRTGNSVTVTDAEGNVYNVVTADVAIENGVVHVIDGVLLPTL
ncbi:fasciclin domain-containing protein [Algoriphagus hitonicola]|uniref:Uncaracterized surface protein containing fasciclin (FAS1) repeats n=1 Tax=Algoriphagus hitonicola TaxID=435880 RepID=A0A1I2TZN4_9BACT|nr:fasciclin domain-containing protein [Algoriphagus hitonicola]SFG67831.1 Uncaracterized surface protein containing fasciclin (FAS1) repeats [Algoriphagus hitonicola]